MCGHICHGWHVEAKGQVCGAKFSYHPYIGPSDRTQVAKLYSKSLSHLAGLKHFFSVVNSILFIFMFSVIIVNGLHHGILKCTWLCSYLLLSTSLFVPLLPLSFKIINPLHFHDNTFLNTLILVYSQVNSQKGCYVCVYIKLTLTYLSYFPNRVLNEQQKPSHISNIRSTKVHSHIFLKHN